MLTWEHFHSLYEAMAAINVGIFAFPRLSEPVLRAEDRRWRMLRNSVAPEHHAHLRIESEARHFNVERRRLEATIDRVRGYCLVIGTFAAGMLCFATARADELADPVVAWGSVVVMVTPPVVMFGLNNTARYKLSGFAVIRRQLELEVMS